MSEVEQRVRARLTEKVAEAVSSTIPNGTPRLVHGTVQLSGKATAVIGMRRAGKTTYLHQLRRDQLASGAPREAVPYVNFEDEQLAGMEAQHLGFLLDAYGRALPPLRGAHSVSWYLDEIQVVPGWEAFVRRVLDSDNVRVVISGSSARLLSREIATSMRGRAWEVRIYPFGFGEALTFAGTPVPPDPSFLTSAERATLEHALVTYLGRGGFPEAQPLAPRDQLRLMQDYVDVAILRDVVERHQVTNVTALRSMVRHLLGNAGSSFSVEKFHASMKSQGIPASRDTVHELLGHLDDCFLVRPVWLDDDSERRRMVNPRKVYPIDPGLTLPYARFGKTNVGHALETIVLIELERRHAEVGYVKTKDGFEVDFIARYPSGDVELVQVCADVTDAASRTREIRALVAAADRYPGAQRRLLTLYREVVPDVPAGIEVMPAYEWLLSAAGAR
ncbi:MAG: ATP-binding protein [Myxococcales bacterium]|nr:ATP-binding protein [Myxococcales bacterium]